MSTTRIVPLPPALRLPLAVLALAGGALAQSPPTLLWSRAPGIDAYSHDAIASDGARGAFVASSTTTSYAGPLAGAWDAVLERIASDGSTVWARQFGGPGIDRPADVVSDGSGGAVIVGKSTEPIVAGSTDLSWIARYDGAGQLLWLTPFGSSALTPFGLTRTSDGAYVVLSSIVPAGAFSTVHLARFDAGGAPVFSVTTSWGSAVPRDIVADLAGGVYASATISASLFSIEQRVGRFDASGAELWRRVPSTAFTGDPNIAADGSGGVCATGTILVGGVGFQYLRQWNDAGTTLVNRNVPSWSYTSEQLEYVPGMGFLLGAIVPTGPGSTWDMVVDHFDTAGTPVWRASAGLPEDENLGRNLVIDELGGIWISGNTNSDDARLVRFAPPEVGTRVCSPAVSNSSGAAAQLAVVGTDVALDNGVTLVARRMPLGSFGFFLCADQLGAVTPPGSQGTLCLAGALGRYDRAGEVRSSGGSGSFFLEADLTALPSPTGPVAAAAGQTWHFQAWFRDANPGATSNLTDAVSVTLR